MRRALLFAALLLTLGSCGDEALFDWLLPDDGFDPYVEVFATSSAVKVETPYWHEGFRVRLLDGRKKALTPWTPLTSESHVFTGLAALTPYWVEYELDLANEKTKHGLLTMRTMRRAADGYLAATSLLAGETQPLYLSGATTDVTVKLQALLDPDRVLAAWRFTGVPESFTSRKAASFGAEWPSAGMITLPTTLRTGYYTLVFHSAGGETQFPFVVRPARPGKHGLALVASTNTWNAYNGWGNASYYQNKVGGPKLLWSAFGRPISPWVLTGGHLVGGEMELVRWLTAEGIDFDVYTDTDVDAGRLGDAYNTWVFHVHAEYWTQNQSHHYSEHMKAGKRAIFLSGNNAWWLVSYVDDGRRMYKNGAHTNRSAAQYTGTLYTNAGLGTTAPYRCLAPDHWAFAGTGLAEGDRFGEAGRYGGASGHETDKLVAGRKGVTLLARGENEGGGGAAMVVAQVLSGEIFNSGSITFAGALTADTRVATILRNVIRRYNGQ